METNTRTNQDTFEPIVVETIINTKQKMELARAHVEDLLEAAVETHLRLQEILVGNAGDLVKMRMELVIGGLNTARNFLNNLVTANEKITK